MLRGPKHGIVAVSSLISSEGKRYIDYSKTKTNFYNLSFDVFAMSDQSVEVMRDLLVDPCASYNVVTNIMANESLIYLIEEKLIALNLLCNKDTTIYLQVFTFANRINVA